MDRDNISSFVYIFRRKFGGSKGVSSTRQCPLGVVLVETWYARSCRPLWQGYHCRLAGQEVEICDVSIYTSPVIVRETTPTGYLIKQCEDEYSNGKEDEMKPTLKQRFQSIDRKGTKQEAVGFSTVHAWLWYWSRGLDKEWIYSCNTDCWFGCCCIRNYFHANTYKASILSSIVTFLDNQFQSLTFPPNWDAIFHCSIFGSACSVRSDSLLL